MKKTDIVIQVRVTEDMNCKETFYAAFKASVPICILFIPCVSSGWRYIYLPYAGRLLVKYVRTEPPGRSIQNVLRQSEFIACLSKFGIFFFFFF